jgi:uncharacterized protein (TIGR02145 family)
MKQFYFLLSFFIIATAHAQNDSIFFWKSGALLEKRSIKPADLDSITFKRPLGLPITIPNVTICTQVWATRNLDVITYSDGTPIPQETNPTVWATLTTGAWCYYNNDSNYGITYGKLYNWYAAAGIYNAASLTNPALRKKLAPTGWHVPSDAEWTTLTDCLGGLNIAGGKMKDAVIGYWNSPNSGATNSSGFTGLPGGGRSNYGTFYNESYVGRWWSYSEYSTDNAWCRYLSFNFVEASRDNDFKKNGFSVRCLRD